HGVLARSMASSVGHIPIADCTTRQLALRVWNYEHLPTPEIHALIRRTLEERLATEEHSILLAFLAHLYIVEHSLLINPLPDPLGRALKAARRAIELDRSNQRGWEALAMA